MSHVIPSSVYFGFFAVALACLLGALVRIYRGPTPADRMLAASLMTSTAIGAILLLGRALGAPAARHVALVIVLFGALSVVAFVRSTPPKAGETEERE